jgi:hypothetical protein
MPKKLLATTIIIALAITILSAIPTSKENFYPIPSMQIMGYNPSYPNGSNYTFTVDVRISMNAPAIVSISYSLDGETNITSTDLTYTTWFPSNLPNNHQIYSISKNLHDLEVGNHTINAYALDAKGKILSETRWFTVANSLNSNSPTPTQSESPTSKDDNTYTVNFSFWVIVTVGVLIIISLGLLVYFKRRKGKS